MPRGKEARKVCPVTGCENLRAFAGKSRVKYRWGCQRCYQLSLTKPEDILAFAVQHAIYDGRASTPRTTSLRPRSQLTPKSQKISDQQRRIQTLAQECDAARQRSRDIAAKYQETTKKSQALEMQAEAKNELLQVKNTVIHEKEEVIRKLQFERAQLHDTVKLLTQSNDRILTRRDRLLSHIDSMQKQLSVVRARLKDEQDDSQELHDRVETLEKECAELTAQIPPPKRARGAYVDFFKCRYQWAKEYYNVYARPRKWTKMHILHFAVALCKMKEFGVSISELIHCFCGTKPIASNSSAQPIAQADVHVAPVKVTKLNTEKAVGSVMSGLESESLASLLKVWLGGQQLTQNEVKQLADMVPTSVREVIIRQWVSKLQEHWTPLRCAYVKARCVGSDAKWLRFVNTMFRAFKPGKDGKPGRHVSMKLGNVAVPVPSAKYSINKIRATAAQEKGAQIEHHGLVAYRPFVPSVSGTWQKTVDTVVAECGTIARQKDLLQTIIINPMADKARARGARAGVTAIGVRVATNLVRLPNSMTCVTFVSYGEHNDSNEDLRFFAKKTLDEINSLLKAGSIQIEHFGTMQTFAIKPFLSLDGACLSSCYCHGSFLGSYPCPLCRIEKADLMDTRLSVARAAKKRTLRSIRVGTHRQSTGDSTCDGCGMYVCDTDAEVKQRGGKGLAIRVCRGADSDPPKPWTRQTRTVQIDGRRVKITKTWEQWHFGLVYGMEVVWWAEPSCAILCNLHRQIQTVPLLIMGLVARHLDPDWEEQCEGPQVIALCKVVNHFGREVLPLEQPEKFPKLTGGRTLYGRHGRLASGLRVDGNSVRNWDVAYNEVLDIVFHDRQTVKRRRKQFKKAVQTWKAYLAYNNLLLKPYEYPKPMVLCDEDEIQQLWDARAKQVEAAAMSFLQLFRETCNGIGEKSFYLHAMLAHVPDNVRAVGSVAAYSTEALESGHHWMNETLVHRSNSRKFQRMKQVMDAKVTEEYILENEPVIAKQVARDEERKIIIKERRVVAAKRRAEVRLDDVKRVKQECDEEGSYSALGDKLFARKLERDGPKCQK